MDINTPIGDLPKVGPILTRKFERLGVNTVEDLFYHAPSRYLDYSQITTIKNIRASDVVTIHAKIVSIKNIYSRRGLKMQIGSVEDASGKLTVVWFNQPYLIKTLYPGRLVALSGKVSFFSRKLCLSSPDYELIDESDGMTVHTGRLVPVYPETSGLSSKWIRRVMLTAHTLFIPELKKDFLPERTLRKYKLDDFADAVSHVHFPKSLKEAEKGRERLAFDELLSLQLKSVYRKAGWKKIKPAFKLKIEKGEIKKFISKLPFELTSSQKKAVSEITQSMEEGYPMNRLLQGDVGSGKTVVAAVGAFAVFLNGYQTVVMAPTQILAAQHYETFKKIFAPYNLRVSLITSDVKKIELGRSDVFIGTHALIHKKVMFDKVAFVIIDEQHRFGVEQRQHLVKKSGTPHVLTMTATPIPRTVALTAYGDLDMSVLTEMPEGRQNITTWIVSDAKRNDAYSWIKGQIKKHKTQAFVVCPLIEESSVETMQDIKAVTTEFKKLALVFKDLKLGLLHGRLKPRGKEAVLDSFRKGKIDILVTTPVVEVGIDIPNANIMVVEASERFGLAQLHQLRGRVGRGEAKSYALLFSNFRSGNAFLRLKAMEKTNSGFELSELDLKMRGPGEIFGKAQSGFPELKVASWNNYALIESAREAAEDVFRFPSDYPVLAKKVEKFLHVA